LSHWYDKDGKPNHFAGPKGKGTTLREARKLNLYPSVTAIGDILAKPTLVNWLQEQAVLQTLETPYAPVSEEWGKSAYDGYGGWAKYVIAAARKKTMALADKGSDIHDILEEWFSSDDPYAIGSTYKLETVNLCEQVCSLLVEKCGTQTWTPEVTFSHKLGFGGKCDLHSEAPFASGLD